MWGKKLSEAMGGISDDKVQEAAFAYRRGKGMGLLTRFVAVAAVLAIVLTGVFWPIETQDGIITAPGVVRVYAYDVTSGASIADMTMHELEEDALWCPYPWSIALNCLYGLPVKLEVQDKNIAPEDITISVKLNYGSFIGNIELDKYKENPSDPVAKIPSATLGKEFVIENGETIFWQYPPDTLDEVSENRVYAQMFIYAEGHIIGCALVEIRRLDETGSMFGAFNCGTAYFPKVNGRFQDVPESAVQQMIEQWM